MSKIADVIDARLKELGIKGSKMCDDLGISRSTLTELRKGRSETLKVEKAVMIASYLGITAEELLGEKKGRLRRWRRRPAGVVSNSNLSAFCAQYAT